MTEVKLEEPDFIKEIHKIRAKLVRFHTANT